MDKWGVGYMVLARFFILSLLLLPSSFDHQILRALRERLSGDFRGFIWMIRLDSYPHTRSSSPSSSSSPPSPPSTIARVLKKILGVFATAPLRLDSAMILRGIDPPKTNAAVASSERIFSRAEASEREYRTNDITLSYEDLRKHFRKKLDDVAKILEGLIPQRIEMKSSRAEQTASFPHSQPWKKVEKVEVTMNNAQWWRRGKSAGKLDSSKGRIWESFQPLQYGK
ncbi:hypothetical protein LguiA_004891 [Lonicera macranthoides]